MSEMRTKVFGFEDVGYHAQMLLDQVRVEAFHQALLETVTPNDVVVDIGAGTGILALLAARAGARRVVAVERGPMALLARELVAVNDLADRVAVVQADARDVDYEEPPTVIVSETLGPLAIDEAILGLIGTVRKRCAAQCRVIPRCFTLHWSALQDRGFASELQELDHIAGLQTAPMRGYLANRILHTVVRPDELVGPDASSEPFQVGESVAPDRLRISLTVSEPCSVNAIGAWFKAELSDSVRLSTAPGAPQTCWPNLKFPVDPPLACQAGDVLEVEVLPRLLMDRALWAWSVRLGQQRRTGDSFQATPPDPQDLFRGAGLPMGRRGRYRPSPRLEAWAAMLDGGLPAGEDEMVERLLRAQPHRYAEEADARDEMRALLAAANATS